MTVANPFTPVFGRVPPCMAGRDSIVSDILGALSDAIAAVGTGDSSAADVTGDVFSSRGADPNLCTMLSGARGTGKTALLSLISSEAAAMGWTVANVSAEEGMLEDVIERAIASSETFTEGATAGARLTSLSVGGLVGAQWEYRDASSGNWRTRVSDLCDQVAAAGSGLLVTVDEVKPGVGEMVKFASVWQHLVREERPVALLMAGLPSQVSALVTNESVSFLRRARIRNLSSVTDEEVRVALRKSVEGAGRRIADDGLEMAADAIGGFPYMMQLVGFHSWAANPNSPEISVSDVHDGILLARSDFKTGVLDATWHELSDGDVAFLEAMLPDNGEPTSVAAIAERSGKSRDVTRVYKSRLVSQGLVTEVRRGWVSFELPGLREYLEEKL